MRFTKTFLATAVMLLTVIVGYSQDKTTGAIKGKVKVEVGSPNGVTVVLRQGDTRTFQCDYQQKWRVFY